jgi:hypothetical protein
MTASNETARMVARPGLVCRRLVSSLTYRAPSHPPVDEHGDEEARGGAALPADSGRAQPALRHREATGMVA